VATAARRWVENLPEGGSLELAPKVALDGQGLADVRARLQIVANEIAKLRAAPVASADIRARVVDYVQNLAARAAPNVCGVGNKERQCLRSWKQGTPRNLLGMTCYLHGDALVVKLLSEPARRDAPRRPIGAPPYENSPRAARQTSSACIPSSPTVRAVQNLYLYRIVIQMHYDVKQRRFQVF
jgi:hypothetical protein